MTPGCLDGERAPVRLLTGDDQDDLGRVSPEHPADRGLLPGLRTSDRDGMPLPWGICGDQGGTVPLPRG